MLLNTGQGVAIIPSTLGSMATVVPGQLRRLTTATGSALLQQRVMSATAV